MLARWCISAFIFTLTLFGVISQQQMVVPNQEIVLQFSDVELSTEDANNTVAIVKSQLLELGVKNIQVKTQQNGTLKIYYYSDVDISSVKRNFSKENSIVLDYTSNKKDHNSTDIPSGNNAISYNLDVFEIQKSNDLGWDLDGAFVLQIEPKSDRCLDPNLYFSLAGVNAYTSNSIVKVAYKGRRNISIEIGDALHGKPEVRAGPIC